MGKKNDTDDTMKIFDPFVGAEEDDLSDMQYVQDADTSTVDTHPPATKEEAEQRALTAKDEEEEEPAAEAEEEEPVAEEEEAPAAEEEEVVEDDVPKIPKDRFDEVNERRKKAERENEELRRQLAEQQKGRDVEEPAEPAFDYSAKEKEAVDAILEGDTERYDAIQAEIRKALRAEILQDAKKLAAEETTQSREQIVFEETGARIEQTYPQFSEDSANYSEEARQEMLDLFVGYARSGNYTRSEALQRAADRTARMYGFDKPAEPPADNVVNMRKPDVKGKAKTANQQPPATPKSKTAMEASERDIKSMSDEEFESLPETTKRRMRGDIL